MPLCHRPISLIAAVVIMLAGGAAWAHPHVFVDGRAQIIFDRQGRMTAVRNVWEFDRAFSAFASQGLDKNGDGKLTTEELAPLAKTNVDSLKHYGFFTVLTVGRKHLKLKFPDQYFLQANAGRLTLFFELPLETPTAPDAETTLEVYDPEYFVAFTFAKDQPITLFDAPKSCVATYHAPKPLDASIMAKLAAVPIDQHDLPPALRDAALGLANIFTMECKS